MGQTSLNGVHLWKLHRIDQPTKDQVGFPKLPRQIYNFRLRHLTLIEQSDS